ncbi:Syntaxin-binding protein 5-like [Halotydeus destructor]|nr:Syntaxin-binding protein 5-like [Halotydeus destructor]
MAFDPVERLLAIGNKQGIIHILGPPGVDMKATHPSRTAVTQLYFARYEEGAEGSSLVSVCADNHVHLWNLKSKPPAIVQSLKLQRERITFTHLPFQSRWLYMGTDRGNVYVANIETCGLSGYVIMWNKAIELSRKTHPGSVVHLSDCPCDPNKLLIGYESGTMVLWDLRNRSAENRINYPVSLHSVSWHHEGRQFLCSHSDGSMSTWNVKASRPVSIVYPHGSEMGTSDDQSVGKPTDSSCQASYKVEWRTVRGGDSFIVFSGRLAQGSRRGVGSSSSLVSTSASACATSSTSSSCEDSATAPSTPPSSSVEATLLSSNVEVNSPISGAERTLSNSLSEPNASSTSAEPNASSLSVDAGSSEAIGSTSKASTLQTMIIIHGKTTTVLEMETNIVDFITLCESAYEYDYNEPYAVAVLLENDLVVVDLTSTGDTLSDMAGTLFQAKKEVAEPPKQNFFKLLFTGGPNVLDREELFGEQVSGVGSKTMAKAIPGPAFDATKANANSLAGELARVRQGFQERGEHLEKLEDRTAQMSSEAEGFRDLSHQLLKKYKDRKWYQF